MWLDTSRIREAGRTTSSLHPATFEKPRVGRVLLDVGCLALLSRILDVVVMAFRSIALGLSVGLWTLVALVARRDRWHFTHF